MNEPIPIKDHNLIPAQQNDSGKVDMIITPWLHRQQKIVVIRYEAPRYWVGLEPKNAAEMAKLLLDAAQQQGANIQLSMPRREVTKDQRDRLIVRATQVFRSLAEKRRPPAEIARQVVDSVLSAID